MRVHVRHIRSGQTTVESCLLGGKECDFTDTEEAGVETKRRRIFGA